MITVITLLLKREIKLVDENASKVSLRIRKHLAQ